MTILLVNDDGYDAEGIAVLEKTLTERGHDVWVSAPESQMSGKSHAMTISSPLRIRKYKENHYAISGTPVDCILYAKRYEHSLFPHDPDLVISGINNGYNLATDIMYSGTCGAAREAIFCDWKAIAVSAEKCDYSKCALFVADHLNELYDALDLESFININFPPSFSSDAKVTIPGEIRYRDKIVLVEENGDEKMVKITECIREDLVVDGALNDIEACNMGYASISSVSVRSHSHEKGYKKLEEIFK